MAREHDFSIFLPSTKELLLRLHKGSYDCYLAGKDKNNEELTKLENACIMYEYSFQFNESGCIGLKMLGITRYVERRMDVSLQLLEALSKAIDEYNNK